MLVNRALKASEIVEQDESTVGLDLSIDAYRQFLKSKALVCASAGMDICDIGGDLFDFQYDITRWALRKGRCAIFAGTGMGKTVMQLKWSKYAADRVLILAPLAVGQQTSETEGPKFDIEAVYARSEKESPAKGITVTNYERMDAFNADHYGAVVLDESSILKSFTGKTRATLINKFAKTPMRLCCTATPAPNDISEIANHAEFLGVMTRVEMLAAFFVHDDEGWRLKKHATEPFYKWLASWAMSIQKPSDLGYSDDLFVLPPLTVKPVFVEAEFKPIETLFPMIHGIKGRLNVRRGSMESRISRAIQIIDAQPDKQWIVWTGLSDESSEITNRLLGSGVAEVKGSDSQEWKVEALSGFKAGKIRIMVSKVRIAGFGMNFQNCSRMLFVGLGDSWEQYYQAIRRCWRFGQKNAVEVYIVLSEHESVIYNNVMRKERDAEIMASELIKHCAQFEISEIKSGGRDMQDYQTAQHSGDGWKLLLGDSVERMAEVPTGSAALAIFSPPFEALFTYTNTDRDLGNCRSPEIFWKHFAFIGTELLRAMMPGRNVCVHCSQLPKTKQTDGVIGLRDFRGDVIRQFEKLGFIYHGEVCIDKDPQAQAIRTHAKGLLFVQLRKDAAWMRPAYADYIIIFRTPGENPTPVLPDLTNDEWIEWARPVWYNIDITDTLNVAEGRDNRDERHICPLHLGTIERCVRLWSNRGETVLSPFAGIGSEGYQAILQGRNFVGIELKESYYRCAVKNLTEASRKAEAGGLFSESQGMEAGELQDVVAEAV